ncbi:MAG TPA: response regulator [Pseudaminobacter sp.]|nr:response regulator [Pseudaminobacter sp.]
MGVIVAIVDDDEPVRRALRRLLLSLSYQPIIFASGEEFLASLRHASPSCAVVDLHMPGLKGLDVLLRIRSEGLRIPVIIVTGLDQSGMRVKCMAAGASGYLVKPIERSEMASAIEAAIGV